MDWDSSYDPLKSNSKYIVKSNDKLPQAQNAHWSHYPLIAANEMSRYQRRHEVDVVEEFDHEKLRLAGEDSVH